MRDLSSQTTDSEVSNRETEIAVFDQQLLEEQRDSAAPVLEHSPLEEGRDDKGENEDKHIEIFNSFQYWRNPPPSVDIVAELEEWGETAISKDQESSSSGLPEVRVIDVEKPDEVLYFSKQLSETTSDFEEEISLNSSETLAEHSIQDQSRILSQVYTFHLYFPKCEYSMLMLFCLN